MVWAMALTIQGPDGLKAQAGKHLGYSGWHQVTQEQVDKFADATGDHQWIHVDVERAKAGPFGGTIAHGYLTLSLAPALLGEVVRVEGFKMGINYGTDRVRFPSPVPVGSKLRMGVELKAVDEVPGGVQAALEFTFQLEGSEKPACVALALYRYYT
jgi:acyl dehydratase